MSRASFILTYDGPALDTHEMAARDLAPALIAVSDVLEQANQTLNGERTKVAVHVRASFRTGSFGIDFSVVQSLGRQMLHLLDGDNVNGALNLIQLVGFASSAPLTLLALLKKLRGRAIREVITLKDGRFRIVVDDDRYEVELKVLELLRNYTLRQAIEATIAKPLEQLGIERVAVQTDEHAEPFVIEKIESEWYRAPSPEEEELDDSTTETFLQLVTVAFKEQNKWRFSDGSTTFYAAMLDKSFMDRVDRDEERFGKNDLFKVRLRRRQLLDGLGNMRQEAEVLEVIEHRPGSVQLKLPMSPDNEPPPDSL